MRVWLAVPGPMTSSLIKGNTVKAFWLVPLSGVALLAGAPAMKCDALASKSFGKEVTISSATLVAAKGTQVEHCDVLS